MPTRFSLLGLIAIGAILWVPTLARAQPPIEQRLTEYLMESEELYDWLQLEDSRDALVEAIYMAEEEDYEGTQLAQVHLMLGIVDAALAESDDVVIDHFLNGLLIDETVELNPYYTTPELEELLDRAREELPEEDVGPVEPQTLLMHNPVVTARAGEPIPISVGVPPNSPVRRVLLSFRPDDTPLFEERDMRRDSPSSFSALIPASATERGIHLEYYLMALDATNQILETSGALNEPHLVIILGGSEGDGENGEAGPPIVSLGLGIGTGGGLATGQPLVMYDEVDLNPGIALTPLHFYFETLANVGGGIAVGPFVRLQSVLLRDGIEWEAIFGGKAKWFFLDDGTRRMYASIGGGYGHVRHTVDLNPTFDFVDTTREGPGHGGVGLGFAFMFNRNAGILNDIYAMVLFGETSVQLDYNLAFLFSF